jgi:hypothetical protein
MVLAAVVERLLGLLHAAGVRSRHMFPAIRNRDGRNFEGFGRDTDRAVGRVAFEEREIRHDVMRSRHAVQDEVERILMGILPAASWQATLW